MSSGKEPGKPHAKRQSWLVWVVAAAAFASDLGTKLWATSFLSEGETSPLLGSLITFQLIRNPGAAFSLGAGSAWIFTVLTVGVLGILIWYSRKVTSPVLAVILGLLAGGAVGNLADRLLRPPGFARGHVVDFLNYNDWFIGNVADIWIVVGAVGLFIYFVRDRDPSGGASRHARPEKNGDKGGDG